MSAIVRTGERFGTGHLIDVLTGTATEAIRVHGHDGLKTFGVGRDRPAAGWRSIIRQLHARDLIALGDGDRGGWSITAAGGQVLRGLERIELRGDEPATATATATGGRRSTSAGQRQMPELAPADADLLAGLKVLRATLARTAGVPAYVVFADRTLIEMAVRKPLSRQALAMIHGVGEAKLGRYGETFLRVIRERCGVAGG